jgi:predicted dehydrogenase
VLAPHDLAIALEILGCVPRPVHAVGVAAADDVLHMHALLQAGPAWHTLTVSSRTPERRRSVELHCAEGTASLAGGWDTHVTIRRVGTADTDGERVETPGELPLLAELRAFARYLDGGPPPKSSGAEGAEVVAAIRRLRDFVLWP